MQAILDLSRDQLEDLMLLRQLYITRRHLLNETQSKLMAGGQQKSAHPLDSVMRMSDLAAQLVENAAEEHTLLYKVSRAFYCGVGQHCLNVIRQAKQFNGDDPAPYGISVNEMSGRRPVGHPVLVCLQSVIL